MDASIGTKGAPLSACQRTQTVAVTVRINILGIGGGGMHDHMLKSPYHSLSIAAFIRGKAFPAARHWNEATQV